MHTPFDSANIMHNLGLKRKPNKKETESKKEQFQKRSICEMDKNIEEGIKFINEINSPFIIHIRHPNTILKCNNEEIIEIKETISKSTKYVDSKLKEINECEVASKTKYNKNNSKKEENIEKGLNEKFLFRKSFDEDNNKRNVVNLGKYYERKRKLKEHKLSFRQYSKLNLQRINDDSFKSSELNNNNNNYNNSQEYLNESSNSVIIDDEFVFKITSSINNEPSQQITENSFNSDIKKNNNTLSLSEIQSESPLQSTIKPSTLIHNFFPKTETTFSLISSIPLKQNLDIIHSNSFSLYGSNSNLNLQSKIQQLESSLSYAQDNYTSIQSSLHSLLNELRHSESYRMELHKLNQKMRGNIRVYCRVKPILNNPNIHPIFTFPETNLITTNTNTSLSLIDLCSQTYFFDKVFTDLSTQEDIFSEIEPALQSALDGENITICAYGATGTGKTFTMQGPPETNACSYEITHYSGILPRAAEYILKEYERKLRIESPERKMKSCLEMCACEIYNENVYDLLLDQSNNAKVNVIMNTNEIKGLSSYKIKNKQDIIDLCLTASKMRKCDSTAYNYTSSRSHAIYMIKICINGIRKVNSVISIVDLAGSEKGTFRSLGNWNKDNVNRDALKKTQNESGFINKSLTALGRVISIISDKKKGNSNRQSIIPYRDSKLTMILKNSLNSQSKTILIVTVVNDVEYLTQTKETFAFASNALYT